VRRLATAHTQSGKSVFIQDGQTSRVITFRYTPGLEVTEIWATGSNPILPVPHEDPIIKMSSSVPGPEETRFRIVRFPPARELSEASPGGTDAVAARAEQIAKMPGLGELHEVDDPGMHTTDTIDYGVVISGEIWLELDDGAIVHLQQGDCIVQNGTRHAWRNPGSEPCLMAFVMIGVKRQKV